MNHPELVSSLRTVISALHKGLRKQAYSASAYSMTEIETIAHILRSGSLMPTELAALTRIKTQSMSQVLNRLEAQDIIKRTPSDNDKRKVYISLSAAGKKMVEKIKYEKDEWLKTVIEQQLSEKEKTILIKALPVLYKLAEIK